MNRQLATLLLTALTVVGSVALCFAQPRHDTPSVGVTTFTRSSITLEITAGASGASAGFKVEWMRRSEYDALGGWPAPGAPSSLIDCTMYGIPTWNEWGAGSTFAMAPFGVARAEMGDLFDETGVEADYLSDLVELSDGTEYAFRVRVLASDALDDSDWSPTAFASTKPRQFDDCTYTQGYWKNHEEAWPVNNLTLGNVNYTKAQLLQIFGQPAAGNGLIILAHQLIATKLNIAAGASSPANVQAAIASADAKIGNLVIPPIGAGSLPANEADPEASLLDDYNNGEIGPGHCDQTAAPSSTWGTVKTRYR